MSGDTNVRTVPCAWLSAITKPVPPVGAMRSSTTLVMRAGPGASVTRRAMNSSMTGPRPSASMKTPAVSLPTCPAKPSSEAKRCT